MVLEAALSIQYVIDFFLGGGGAREGCVIHLLLQRTFFSLSIAFEESSISENFVTLLLVHTAHRRQNFHARKKRNILM